MTSRLEALNYPLRTDAPIISFAQFREFLVPYAAASLVPAIVEVAWRGWKSEYGTWLANEAGLGFAPLLVPLAVVCATGRIEAAGRDVGDLFYRYTGVRQSMAEASDFADGIARAAISSETAFLIPDRATARTVGQTFAVTRIMSASWLPSRIRNCEFLRTLWLAERLDANLGNLDRVSRALGMELDVFVRSALVLFAAALISAPSGRIPIAAIGAEALSRYGIDRDVIELAAFRLSATAEDIQAWIARSEAFAPAGMVQQSPSILVSAPLLRMPNAASGEYLCPSPVHLMTVVRDRVREAISLGPDESNEALTLYGDLLEEYVELVARSNEIEVLDVNEIDPNQERHADLILIEQDAALILEVKRSMGVSFGARGLTRPTDVVAVLEHFLGAYRQCLATYERRRWEATGVRPTAFAALVLIDESIAAEGAAFSRFFARQTRIELPFEVMGLGEFEDALGVLGARRLVSLIRAKFDAGMFDVPLAQYAMQVLRIPTREMPTREYLRPVAAQLGPELATLAGSYVAKWP